jgi:hypothetical protein
MVLGNDSTAPVIAGLAIGIGLIVVFANFMPPTPQKNEIVCGGSIETVKATAPFKILVPTKLPNGYSLQSINYVPNVYVTMEYFSRSLCDPNVPYSVEEGVIEVVEGPLVLVSNAVNGEEYVQKQMESYRAYNFNATAFVFRDGRMHGVGYEAGSDYNAHLWVVNDMSRTLVKIEARSNDTSLEQLAMMAESLT